MLETAHTAFCMQFIYDYVIVGFSDYLNFLEINWCGLWLSHVVCSV